jgi:mannitol-1-/sugar-/sorbitol-6-phosphatase
VSDSVSDPESDESLFLPCRAVLFDCDGVLVDSEVSVVRAWSRWAYDHALPPEVVVPLIHGRRAEETVRELMAPADRPPALEHINRLELEDAAAVAPLAGAAALLRAIPRDRWAVVTSGASVLTRARLAAAGLPQPDVLVTGDHVQRGKPDPQGYLLAAARLGVPPSGAVVVEDTERGVAAGRRSGVSAVIGVGERALSSDADVVVRDLTHVTWADGLLVRRDGLLHRPRGATP